MKKFATFVSKKRLARPARLPISLAVLSLMAGSAWAQSTEAAKADSQSAEPAKLEAVVVTGQGRTQQLQSVPIAIQVMSADQMSKLGAVNLSSVDSFVPGLKIEASQPTQPSFYLRGVGTNDVGIGTDALVGIYVDGVYAGKSGGALVNFNDVKRIEVLKGPQGTLFGRNSAGGAISVTTNEPGFTKEGRGLVRLGENGLRHVEALVNQPLSDSLALRASLVTHHSDGYLTDAGTGKKWGGEGAWGAKIALKLQATENTSALLSYEHEKMDQMGRPAYGLVKASDKPLPYPYVPQEFQDPRTAPFYSDKENPRETRDFNGLTLRLEHSLPWAELSSVSAYRQYESFNDTDDDGTRNPYARLHTFNREETNSFSQEFRLVGKSSSVDWLAGASYYQQNARQTNGAGTTTTALDVLTYNSSGGKLRLFSTMNQLIKGAQIPGIDMLGQDWLETMSNKGNYRAFALFGDAIWHLSKQTNLTTGLRLTRDQKDFSWYYPLRTAAVTDQQLAALNAGDFFNKMVAAKVLTATQAAQFKGLLGGNMLFQPGFSNTSPLETQKSWNDVSPRLVLDHQLSKDLMFYGSLTRGYQAGGFNALNINSLVQPEHVTNVELGAKGQFPALGISYSAALFSYRFDNLQSATLVQNATPGGVPSYQITTSDQKATGLDLDAFWQVSNALRLSGALELIDHRYSKGTGSFSKTDLKNQAAGTPKVSLTLGLDYQTGLWGGSFNGGVQWAYRSATRCNTESFQQGECLSTPTWRVESPQHRWDARLGWNSKAGTSGHSWGLGLTVNNLTNERYVEGFSNLPEPVGTAFARVSKPRSIAVELRASY